MRNKEKKMSYASEGLAVPEIRFDREDVEEELEKVSGGIHFENVAIPEIHMEKKKYE